MIIKWYNCKQGEKHLNKTLTFIDSSTCNIFGICSVDNPSFIVDSVKGNYVSFDNICYFVDDSIYNNGKWVIKCTYDDLANSYNEIKNLRCLIMRNENSGFSYIPDTAVITSVDKDIRTALLTGGTKLGNVYNSRNFVLTVV